MLFTKRLKGSLPFDVCLDGSRSGHEALSQFTKRLNRSALRVEDWVAMGRGSELADGDLLEGVWPSLPVNRLKVERMQGRRLEGQGRHGEAIWKGEMNSGLPAIATGGRETHVGAFPSPYPYGNN